MSNYTIEVRSYQGQVLATGQGHTDWTATLERIARKAKLDVGNGVAVDNYFPTDAGRTWGTHHVQFGRSVRTGGTSLSSTYVVSVQVADAASAQRKAAHLAALRADLAQRGGQLAIGACERMEVLGDG
jgi:hypothetical protein